MASAIHIDGLTKRFGDFTAKAAVAAVFVLAGAVAFAARYLP